MFFQVLYAEQKIEQILPQASRTALFLGNWHVYKIVCTVIWRLAAADVFGPFFHVMWPEMKFPESPRLMVVSRIFSLFRLAYPSVRESLKARITELGEGALKTHAKNLEFLLDWLIPKVGFSDEDYVY